MQEKEKRIEMTWTPALLHFEVFVQRTLSLSYEREERNI